MPNKFIIIIIGILFIFLLLIGGGVFFMWNKISTIESANNDTTEEVVEIKEEEQNEERMIGPIFPLDTFVINLADPSGDKYARIRMDLELKNEELLEEFEKRSPKIYDAILMILSSKLSEQIRTTKGKNDLREEIILRLNEILNNDGVTNLYFREFVIQ